MIRTNSHNAWHAAKRQVETQESPRHYEAAGYSYQTPERAVFSGEKYAGGMGAPQVLSMDYYALRTYSEQLFTENLYAQGMIKRLVTNEINTGLTPECCPDEGVIGVAEESLADWTETTEARFNIYAKSPKVCDFLQMSSLYEQQSIVRQEAIIGGDILSIMRVNQRTGMPNVQIVKGENVVTPFEKPRNGNTIDLGVECDPSGRQVAFWVRQKDGTIKRIPAWGERSGRRVAWLTYGTRKRIGKNRGMPLLAVLFQSMKEIDRYRDSTQRKATINSILAMFIKKEQALLGTLPIQNGAVKRGTATVTDLDATQREFNITDHVPGLVLQELQQGETPIGFGNQGTDDKFGTFEEAIVQAMAWAVEIPPEIVRLAFSNNYSASQAAINEFKIYLNWFWPWFGDQWCGPIFNEWLISEALTRRTNMPGFLEAWRDPSAFDVYGAWLLVDWYGSIKPSTDMLKQVKASDLLVLGGYSTRARESRIMTGTKFSTNVKRLKRENEQLKEANAPLVPEVQNGQQNAAPSLAAIEDAIITALEDRENVAS